MTTLYKPVTVETEEQAEDLPIGTVATSVQNILPVSAVKAFGGEWTPTTGVFLNDRHMVGWTALVPIEAEEEFDSIAVAEGEFDDRIRLVTPWEEV